ncbi:hypothetical protein [Brevibacillus composti]|uniref:DUF2508 family protein n=1 Tax=Brevibacillus composti TaxID=2796470 RepID=A0A7T5EM93_9BACL|nr:hypothetical protein [Brevibacillus composti]QQE75187.1 hypothetical protein JD108_04450 [Brevibacillus composti]
MDTQIKSSLSKYLQRGIAHIEAAHKELDRAKFFLGAAGCREDKYLVPMRINLEMLHEDLLFEIKRLDGR